MNRASNCYQVLRKGADIYLQPKEKHTHTLVFMHGLGDTADGYLDFFTDRTSPTPATMKVVLLTAPTCPVTINMGMRMPSWFDFRDFDITEANFKQAIAVDQAEAQARRIAEVLTSEIAVLNGESKKVFLGGFSQGAAMTLLTGLSFDKTLGGLLVFSGFNFPTVVENANNANTPILISHGALDPLLPWAKSQKSYEKLNQQAHKIQIEVVNNLAHSFNERSLRVFKGFLESLAV